MRTGLAVSTVLAGFLLAACGGGAGTTPATSEANAPAPEPAAPARTGAAKSLDVADPCSLVTPEQAKSLGVDQAPEPGDSNGKQGCDFLQGQAGGGFMAFVAANKGETFKQFVESRPNAEVSDLGGYPLAQVGTNQTNCVLAVDVSDQGTLFINGLVPAGNPNPCDLSKRFAEAALQNLPNA